MNFHVIDISFDNPIINRVINIYNLKINFRF